MLDKMQLERAKYINDIAVELENAPHGEKENVIKRASEWLGLSKSATYAQVNAFSVAKPRKTRADKGLKTLSKQDTAAIANLMMQSERQNKKSLMSCRTAIDLAYSNGLIKHKVSESTALRCMKAFGLHPTQTGVKAVTKGMRSLHPNHAWQFDVSICVLYYLNGKKGMQVMEESEFYKNKPNNAENIKTLRVLRYLVTDHYSCAFHLGYIHAAGEDVASITQFLIEAFSKRSTPELLHGIPKMMIWDAGSANISATTRNLLDKLGIQHTAHTPGKPWAKGQVEKMHDVIEREFECRLAFLNITSIEQLNQMATQWSINFQSQNIHSRHKQTRFAMWQTIKQEQLIIAPGVEVMKSFVNSKPESRSVSSHQLEISFKGRAYSLVRIPHVHAKLEVMVSVNLYRSPAIDVEFVDEHGEIHRHIVEPIITDDAGFSIDAPVFGEEHKAIAKTLTEKNKEEMDTAAWGTSDPNEIKKGRKGKNKQVAFNGEINPMADVEQQTPPSFIQRKGTPMNLSPVQIKDHLISNIQAFRKLSRELNIQGSALNPYKEKLLARYPDGLTDCELDAFIKELEEKSHVITQASAL